MKAERLQWRVPGARGHWLELGSFFNSSFVAPRRHMPSSRFHCLITISFAWLGVSPQIPMPSFNSPSPRSTNVNLRDDSAVPLVEAAPKVSKQRSLPQGGQRLQRVQEAESSL
jgi:hypothetical protein